MSELLIRRSCSYESGVSCLAGDLFSKLSNLGSS